MRAIRLLLVGLMATSLVLMGCGKDTKTKPTPAKKEAPAKKKAAPAKKKAPAKKATPTKKATPGKTQPSKAIDLSKPLAPGIDWIKISKDPAVAKLPKASKGQAGAAKVAMTGIAKPIKGFTLVKPTGLSLAYGDAKTPGHKAYEKYFRDSKYFSRTVDALNKLFKINASISVQLTACGEPNAWWNPASNRIILCYEYLDLIARLLGPSFKDNPTGLGNAVLGAFTHTFWHEAGHMFRHIFSLPVTGREEDAVDQLATLVLLDTGHAGAISAIMAAQFFNKLSTIRKQDSYAGEHSLDKQRFYNILCLILGSDVQKFSWLVTKGFIPKKRAVRCMAEYKKIGAAWATLLKPHRNSGAHTGNVQLPTPQVGGGQPTPSPRTTPAPRRTPAPSGGNKQKVCKDAAIHVIGLLIKMIQKQTPPAKLNDPKFKEKVRKILIKYGRQILSDCVSKWSTKQIQCVMRATTVKQIEGCK